MLENKQFVADIKSGQSYQVITPEGELSDTYDVSVGLLRGTNRQIKAIVCDGAHEGEPWMFYNVVDQHGHFNDYVAILGASSPEQAERLSRKHFNFDSALAFKAPISIIDNSLKLFLDSAFTPSRTDFLLEPDVKVFDSMITKEAAVWGENNELESHDGYLANLILDMVKHDLGQDLVTQVSNKDIIEMLFDDNTEVLVADAMIMQYRQLDLAMKRLTEALKNAGDDEFFIKTVTPIEPFKRFGVVNVGVIFEMSDEQRITVLFNNPDSTPSKLMPNDVITSWKWILNKRDVTAILQPRAVEAKRYPFIAQRMFKLLAKNHARFKRIQAQKMRDEQLLNELINQLEAEQSMSRQLDKTLADLSQQIDDFAAQKQLKADEQIQFKTPLNDQEISMDSDELKSIIAQLPKDFRIEPSKEKDFFGIQVIYKKKEGFGVDINKRDGKYTGYWGRIVSSEFNALSDAVTWAVQFLLTDGKSDLTEKREQYNQKLDLLKSWVSEAQFAVLESYAESDELDGHLETVSRVYDQIKSLPKLAETDGQGRNAMAILHYFMAGSDWYFTEADDRNDGFGYASINGQDLESGYLSASEITGNGAELDLNFTEVKIAELDRSNNDDAEKSKAIAAVDGAYSFDATDNFKWFVSDSLAKSEYSPFISAMTIDERVKSHGGAVKWGQDQADKGDIYRDGEIIGYVDIGGDGKSMIYVSGEDNTRVGDDQNKGFKYTENEETLKEMVDILFGVQPSVPVVEGDEFGDFELPEELGDLRASVKEKMLEMVGKTFPCPALNAEVEIRKSGIKKQMSLSGDPRKLQAMAALKELLLNATKVKTEPSYDPKESTIKAYHFVRSPIQINEQNLSVMFVIREDVRGQYHYDHTIEKSELKNAKSPLLDGLSAAIFPTIGVTQSDLSSRTYIGSCRLHIDSIKNNQDQVNVMLDDAGAANAMVLNMFIVDEEEGNDDTTAFLNDVISGNVDLSADATGAKLEEIGASLEGTNEQLFNEAVNAYVNFALNNAQSLTNA